MGTFKKRASAPDRCASWCVQFLSIIFWGVSASFFASVAYAADTKIINSGDGFATPEQTQLYTSAPASCTEDRADPFLVAAGLAFTDCNQRGNMAVAAAANNIFFFDHSWSDLRDGDWDGNGVSNEDQYGIALPTDMGQSWLPDTCWGPQCGHIMRGDVLIVDLGLGYGTWLLGEQFSWGSTSYVDTADLSIEGSGRYPAGVTRMQVRMAIGIAATGGNCAYKLEWDCVNGEISGNVDDAPSGRVNDNPGVDADIWGRCDPDRFLPYAGDFTKTLDDFTKTEKDSAEEQLLNCLYRVATTPLTSAVQGDAYDPTWDALMDAGMLNDRTYWVDQVVMTVLHNNDTPDEQDMHQLMRVAVGFRDRADMAAASYMNDWNLMQTDEGTRTYDNAMNLAVSSRSPQRISCAGSTNPDCASTIGLTNPTVDPFWGESVDSRDGFGEAIKDALTGEIIHDYTGDFGFARDVAQNTTGTGQGIATWSNMSFMYVQSVEGYLSTCMNCDSPDLLASGVTHAWDHYVDEPWFQDYTSSWNVVPTVVHAPL